MVKRLEPMGSNKFLILVFLCCFLVNVSCGNKQSKFARGNPIRNNKAPMFNNSIKQTVVFKPDSTINGILILNNRKSSKKFYSKMSSENRLNFFKESPVLAFSNDTKEEYLLLYQYEGGIKNEFDCFEIGYMNNLKKEIIITKYKDFKTESDLRLGMSFKELIDIKGKSYIKKGNKIIYRIDEYSYSDFLKRYNMPGYFLECTLKDNKVIKIKLGFDHP